MGPLPPIGYDDGSIIPLERLKKVVNTIDERLAVIQKLSREKIPQSVKEEIVRQFEVLDNTTEELDLRSSEVVRKVFYEYKQFWGDPEAHASNLRDAVVNLKNYLRRG
jgi:hypothetical protein